MIVSSFIKPALMHSLLWSEHQLHCLLHCFLKLVPLLGCTSRQRSVGVQPVIQTGCFSFSVLRVGLADLDFGGFGQYAA